MSIFNFLQLQPVDPTSDGTVSDLDTFDQDETIDLTADMDEQELERKWEEVIQDFEADPEKLNFSEE